MSAAIAIASAVRSERRWRRIKLAGSVSAAAGLILMGAFAAWVISLGPLPLAQARQISMTIVDRNGKLLRAYAMADGRWRLPVDAKTGVDPGYLKLLLAYEDRRFRSHAGVDPLALGRAAFQLVTRGHIVSGGSTITMQLARLMEPRRERSVYAKLRQMVRALEIERQLNKDQILDLYLALAPFGGNLEGVRAASIAYFGKGPSDCHRRNPRCWWHCRSLLKPAGLIATPMPRAPRVTAFSIAWSKMVACRKKTLFRRKLRRCRGCASRCPFSRRIPQIKPSPP
jgi:penicillin-binding protein 1C